MQPGPFWNRVSAGLFAILSAAFGAWAFVVWEGVQLAERSVLSITAELRVIQEQNRAHEQRVAELVRRLDTHQGSPWHGQAGNELAALRAELRALRDQLRNRVSLDPGAGADYSRID